MAVISYGLMVIVDVIILEVIGLLILLELCVLGISWIVNRIWEDDIE